jgi:hypothetical protein
LNNIKTSFSSKTQLKKIEFFFIESDVI